MHVVEVRRERQGSISGHSKSNSGRDSQAAEAGEEQVNDQQWGHCKSAILIVSAILVGKCHLVNVNDGLLALSIEYGINIPGNI